MRFKDLLRGAQRFSQHRRVSTRQRLRLAAAGPYLRSDKSCVCRNPFRGLRPGTPARTGRLGPEVSRYVDRSVAIVFTSLLEQRCKCVLAKKTIINETAHLQGPTRKFGKSSTASPQEDDPIESRAHRVIKTTSHRTQRAATKTESAESRAHRVS